MVAREMPAAEVSVDVGLVRRLLADQHPDLAGLPLAEVASGWDNTMYRLGEALAVRLPRRQASAVLVEHEQRWLPGLAPLLPLPISAPVRRGGPGRGYPWSWSIVPWRPGSAAVDCPADDPLAAAETLGRFLAALHRPAPPAAPPNPYRGVPLAARTVALHEQSAWLGTAIDRPRVLARWGELVTTLPWPGPPVWLHGDLHPANVLVHRGRLAAVIDFGDITAGDPATDLAAGWMLVPAEARAAFRAAAGPVDDATWDRSRGWALALSIAYLARSADNPRMARVGRHTLRAVLAELG